MFLKQCSPARKLWALCAGGLRALLQHPQNVKAVLGTLQQEAPPVWLSVVLLVAGHADDAQAAARMEAAGQLGFLDLVQVGGFRVAGRGKGLLCASGNQPLLR